MGPGGELTITSQYDNRQLVISVGDTGIGLQPEQTGQIFDAFFTTKPQGTGMGLPSAAPSSNRTAAACGPAPTPDGAQRFSSPSEGALHQVA